MYGFFTESLGHTILAYDGERNLFQSWEGLEAKYRSIKNPELNVLIMIILVNL